MKIIEITDLNISQYLNDCIEIQKHLVKPGRIILPEQFEKTAQDSHAYFMGVIENENLIGLGVIGKIVHPVNTTGYINNVVVHPDARGQGMFAVIMDNLEQKAKDWNCTDLELTCSREMVQGLYEKRGYVHKETNFYTLKIN